MPADRLITDTSLDYVARRLRFLGYDVVTVRGVRLEALLEAGRREGRVVLTLSRRHPRRFADVRVQRVPRGDPAAAVRQVASAYAPATAPFSRCPRCNLELESREASAAGKDGPAENARQGQSLHFCATCRHWFWFGSHVDRIRQWLGNALGRPL